MIQSNTCRVDPKKQVAIPRMCFDIHRNVYRFVLIFQLARQTGDSCVEHICLYFLTMGKFALIRGLI